MASETAASAVQPRETLNWRGGAVAGLVGGIVFGVMITMQMRPVITHAIPALYGLDGIVAGWVIHLFHSTVLGIGFAALATRALDPGDSLAKHAGLGVAYGFVLWVVLAVVVMAVWLQVVGFPKAPAVPNVSPKSFLGHLVYGAVVGTVYPYVQDL